jgi:hypothetical protein
MPQLQQFIVTVRDDWPFIKLQVTDGKNLLQSDRQQYDVAMPNFEVKLRNVVQNAVEQIIRARRAAL